MESLEIAGRRYDPGKQPLLIAGPCVLEDPGEAMRVALTGEGSGMELDIAVPAIERAADLPPGSGLAPVAGCRERSARVAALLREAASPAGH